MKTHLTRKLIFIVNFILLASVSQTNAQVTIGSGLAPSAGVLLDLKENNDETGGVTATKGILFPRIALTGPTSLSDISGVDLTKPFQYTGLTVYNIGNVESVATGLNTWDGNRWINAEIYHSKSFVRGRSFASEVLATDIVLTGGWRKIPFNSEDFDENDEYNSTSTYEFTPKQSGIYLIYAQCRVTGTLQLGDLGLGILVKRSGDTSYSLLAEHTINIANLLNLNPTTRNVQTLVKLNAGDVIVVGVKSSVDVTLAGTTNSFFTIHQVK